MKTFLCWIAATLIFDARNANGQIAAMFVSADRDSTCASWSSWDNCFWTKAPSLPEGLAAKHQWNKPYFEQMSKECQKAPFYQSVKSRFGAVIENAFEYFKAITSDDKPCGQCSYKHSCGKDCVDVDAFNVAEARCENQEHACMMDPELAQAQYIGVGCKIWPSDKIDLSSLPDHLKSAVNKFELIRCIEAKNSDDQSTCYCCCAPFVVDPNTLQCVRPPSADETATE